MAWWAGILVLTLATPVSAHAGVNLFGDNALRVHLWLNHLPIIGTLMSVLALVLALLSKSIACRRLALVLQLVSTVSAMAVFQAGEEAYEDGRKLADDAGWNWIDVHMNRAEKGIYVFYLAALLTAGALYGEWRSLRWAMPLTVAAGLFGAAAFGGAVWIAEAGGQIRHSELRTNSPEKSH